MQDNLFVLMLQSLAALALVLGLFILLVWGLRKLQFRHLPQDAKVMKVVQRMSIDSKHSVVEMEHGNQRYLLGISPNAMTLISSSEKPMDAESADDKEAEVLNVAS